MKKTASLDSYVLKKRDLHNNYFSIVFKDYPLTRHCRPGQFIQMQLPATDIFFRRPMSIAGVDTKTDQLEVIFKVVGRGTTLMAALDKNDKVNILGPLGKSFTPPKKNEIPVIIAGGVGFPPLMFFAEHLVAHGYPAKQIQFYYGGRSKDDILEKNRIKKLGVTFQPVTEDGSLGIKGLVTAPVRRYIEQHQDKKLKIYACGPEGMLKAADLLGLELGIPGELSLEAPMPCGVGICLGCVVPLRAGGNARVCVEGPIFQIGEVLL